MKASIQQRLAKTKRRIERRLEQDGGGNGGKPMFAAKNIHYELAQKTQAIGVGGIGVIHRLAQQVGLVEAINRRVHVLLIHLPYHESDHVLNLAYSQYTSFEPEQERLARAASGSFRIGSIFETLRTSILRVSLSGLTWSVPHDVAFWQCFAQKPSTNLRDSCVAQADPAEPLQVLEVNKSLVG